MAEDIGINVYADTQKAVRDIGKLNTALGRTAGRAQDLGTAFESSKKALAGVGTKIKSINPVVLGLAGGIAAVGVAFGALAVSSIAVGRRFREAEARLSALTGSAQEARRAFDGIIDISTRTGAELDALTSTYNTLIFVQRDLGLTTEQNLKILENVNNVFALTKVEGAQASSALLQLGQALSNGKVQASEFIPIIEAAPGLVKELAEVFPEAAGSAGQFIQAVKNGEVTSKELAQALLDLNVASEDIPQTLKRAQAQFARTFEEFQAEFDTFLGLSKLIDDASIAGLNFGKNFVKGLTAALKGFNESSALSDGNFELVDTDKLLEVFNRNLKFVESKVPVDGLLDVEKLLFGDGLDKNLVESNINKISELFFDPRFESNLALADSLEELLAILAELEQREQERAKKAAENAELETLKNGQRADSLEMVRRMVEGVNNEELAKILTIEKQTEAFRKQLDDVKKFPELTEEDKDLLAEKYELELKIADQNERQAEARRNQLEATEQYVALLENQREKQLDKVFGGGFGGAVESKFGGIRGNIEQAQTFALNNRRDQALDVGPQSPQMLAQLQEAQFTIEELKPKLDELFNAEQAQAFWEIALGGVQDFGDALADAFVEGEGLKDALEQIGKNILKDILSTIIQMGLKRILLDKLAAATALSTMGGITAAAGAASAALIPAATAQSILTFGASAAAGAAGITAATTASGAAFTTLAALSKSLGFFGGARESGGNVSDGGTYRVNESGPEVFTDRFNRQFLLAPPGGGRIDPMGNGPSASNSGSQIIINNNAPGAEVDVTRNDGRIIEIAVQRAVEATRRDYRDSMETGNGAYSESLATSFDIGRRL